MLYLTFHSYGQYILYPWGYDKLDTKDWRDLQRVGDITKNALQRLNNGAEYQVGSAAKMLYPASGTVAGTKPSKLSPWRNAFKFPFLQVVVMTGPREEQESSSVTP